MFIRCGHMKDMFVILVCYLISSSYAQFNLTGTPSNVVVWDNVTIKLNCTTKETPFRWTRNKKTIAIITSQSTPNCMFSGNTDIIYTFECDNSHVLLSTNVTITAEFVNEEWTCKPFVGDVGASSFKFSVSVPVTNVTITTTTDNNITYVVEGRTVEFVCTTDTSRPAAWIQWYIGRQNITNTTQPQAPIVDGDKFISSSKFVYTGINTDHRKGIYCQAINIKGRNKVISAEKYIYIQIPVTRVRITPAGNNKVISVIKGDTQQFNCTTDATRPAAWIEWYIGGMNMTNLAESLTTTQDDDMLISYSGLVIAGEEIYHKTDIYCKANNIESSEPVESTKINISIKIPVTRVTITPIGDKNVTYVVNGETYTFTCTTEYSRPAAWIQWYIGGKNLTNQAQPQTPQGDKDKFISYSKLNYTGIDSDHNKAIYCEAINIEGKEKAISLKTTMFIQIPVTSVTINPTDDKNEVQIILGEIQIFNCTTDASRPAAWIEWYVGGVNVTNQTLSRITKQDNITFISVSGLVLIGKEVDHNKSIYCKAINIKGKDQVDSTKQTIYITTPVTKVDITPPGDNNSIDVVEGDTLIFTCTTNPSRPAAWIHWYIGGINVTNQAHSQVLNEHGGTFTSFSTWNYTGKSVDHTKIVFCETANIAEKQTVTSLNKSLVIKFGPKNISLDTTKTEYTIIEKGSIRTIICSANCRPTCTFNWTGPNGLASDNSSLKLGAVHRNQTGEYICNANNYYGILSTHKIVLIVNYSPSIVMLNVKNETSENGSATFHCVVESRPASTITWQNSSHILNTSINAHDSYYTIKQANCFQTGTYQCKAENIIDSKVQTEVAEIEFFVLCSVRRDERKSCMLGDIGINDEDPLNITEYLVAYPKPTIKWTFKNESIKFNESIGTFSHYTSILKWQIGINDFGVYTLNASNQIGKPYVRTYDVFPQRKPTPPTNITVECGIISIKVFWRSESNGGDKQRFKVLWWNQAKNNTIYSREIEDLGEGKYHSDTTESLNPNTLYFVFVEAINSHGTVTSMEYMNCTTNQKHTEESLAIGSLVGGIVGSICGVIVIVAVFLIYSRRTKSCKDDREPIRRRKTFEVVDEDDEGLKDNPLYMSSAHASGMDSGQLYSIVNKKSQPEPKEGTHEDVDQGPVYSQIQKPDKKGRQERKGMKAKKHDKNEQQGHAIELGSVYENSEPRSETNQSDSMLYANSAEKDSQSLTKHNYKPSKNKDGLIYADLDLAPGPTGKKFVIRGLENRNNYALIDLTKTAEPLPSSDEDDEKDNK